MSKEEKMMILQMVAEGKVTPEQGAELLRAVGEARPAAPAVPAAPRPPVPEADVRAAVEKAARKAEEGAERVASHAEEWAENMAKRAEDFAERASREGANLGKVLGESGENIGKLIARLFTGSYTGGSRFEFHEEMTGEFPAEGEIQVNLSTSNGRINIDTWDEAGFRLDVRKTVNAATEEEGREIVKNGYEFKQDGLSITARSTEIASFSRGGYSIGFTLTLPRDRKASLRLSSSNGRIGVNGVSGRRIKASTANGRLEVEDCSFLESEIDTANGRIEVQGRPGNLKASTANGRIGARLQGTGDWRLDSANGRIDVEIRKEPDTAYAVDVSAVMGKLEVSGMEDAEVLIDETKQRVGARRYKARSKGFSDKASKATLSASTTVGRVTVTF